MKRYLLVVAATTHALTGLSLLGAAGAPTLPASAAAAAAAGSSSSLSSPPASRKAAIAAAKRNPSPKKPIARKGSPPVKRPISPGTSSALTASAAAPAAGASSASASSIVAAVALQAEPKPESKESTSLALSSSSSSTRASSSRPPESDRPLETSAINTMLIVRDPRGTIGEKDKERFLKCIAEGTLGCGAVYLQDDKPETDGICDFCPGKRLDLLSGKPTTEIFLTPTQAVALTYKRLEIALARENRRLKAFGRSTSRNLRRKGKVLAARAILSKEIEKNMKSAASHGEATSKKRDEITRQLAQAKSFRDLLAPAKKPRAIIGATAASAALGSASAVSSTSLSSTPASTLSAASSSSVSTLASMPVTSPTATASFAAPPAPIIVPATADSCSSVVSVTAPASPVAAAASGRPAASSGLLGSFIVKYITG